MSIPRPDPASPTQVADATFSTGRRGFDQNEVRDFLRMVSAELTRLHERVILLERELETAQENADLGTARFDDETLTRLLGEETARILHAARESSNEIRQKAEQAAAQMLTEASDESTRLREEAEIEASRRRADAANDAEAELSMAKQQGREMVNEARAYRERVLSELARRRELAREQIEQLVHGRDRLMQAFERARLVAVDVVAEMQPLGEPDEYVNLQPSTGPVPVMVARQDVTAAAGEPTDDDSTGQPAGDDSGIYDGSTDELGTGTEVDAEAEEAEVSEVPEETEHAEAEEAETESDTVEAGTDENTDIDVVDTDATADTDEALALDDGSVDDVVVDLFARLRATTDDGQEATDEAETAADDGQEATDEAETADDTGEAVADDTEESGEEEAGEPTPFEQRDADLTPLIVAGARKLKRVLADEQNEVLDALRRSDPVRNLDELLPWSNHHNERYSSMIADDLLEAANAGATLTVGASSARLGKAAGKQAVQQGAESLARSLVAPLRDRLDRCIADGNGDNPAIAKKVRAVYREFKTQHIDEQLDDVFRTAHGRGILASFELDTPVQWAPDPSHDVCPDCDDNRLEGPVAAGQAFPTGHLCTPAHPGCRCILVPASR